MNLDIFSSESFNVIVSTLDSNPLSRMKAESGRYINWILLNPLTYEESLSLFPAKTLNNDLKLLINDCNGHPRTLENLKLLCEEKEWKLSPYILLQNSLVERLQSKNILTPH
jgi:hypothetical protein